MSGPLQGVRVLDLTGPAGNYCGKLFGDLDADVILVEPPGGSELRREGPFIGDSAHLEASLAFAYHNTSKRGLVLDLDHEEGQAVLRELASSASLMLVTARPADMARRGLDYAALCERNPALVYVSITPFGLSGPYADYVAEDIVAMALGGMLYLAGYPDGPPLAAHGKLAYAAASLFAAVAGLAALLSAEETGEGELVDVSIQECVVMGMENAAQFYDLEGTVRKRYAGEQRQAGAGVYHCKDGMFYMLAGGVASNRFWSNFVEWLMEEGVPGAEELTAPRWNDMAYLTSKEAKTRFAAVFNLFARTKTKLELYAVGQQRRIPICPVATPADIMQSRQLRHREFFVKPEHILAREPITMPGAPYRFSATPWRLQRRAPMLGEHTGEILREIGYDAERIEVLLREGVV